MNVNTHVKQMDEMVSQGDILKAIETFFANTAETSDYANVQTASKAQMVEKMQGFLNSIAKVNGITHHRTMVNGDASASEFTFDFDMKDNTRIYWHEIIRRIWNDEGKVVHEEYFDAQNK